MLPLARFRPRTLDALRGYRRETFLADLGAGITVGIVALPLAMAFAIASGLKPEAGLWTAIVGGFLIALLGGSNVQIGGPAGAFIVIVYGIVERYGVANLLISTACAGVLMFALGLLRLGTLVRYVPVGIVTGFTNGIAVLILCSQLKDLLGLEIAKMPADFFAQLATVGQHLDSFNAYAFALGVACTLGLAVWPKLPLRRIPGPVVMLVLLTLLARFAQLPVETIGSRFGGIPQGVPALALPDFSWQTVKLLVTPTLTIALLGAIESLLCARIADQASGLPRHDPNQELMAQGTANFVLPFLGGMPATGTIARTMTNLRSGGTTPVAGMVHALTLAAVVLLAAPLAVHVPLAVLAGILLYVAWNMGEWREFAGLGRYSIDHRLLMLGTFFLTVVFDLTVALQAGLVLACVLFAQRMGSLFAVEPLPSQAGELRYRLDGALFFGAVVKLDAMQEAVESGSAGRDLVLHADRLLALDATGLDALHQLRKLVAARGGEMRVVGLQGQPAFKVRRAGSEKELGVVAAG